MFENIKKRLLHFETDGDIIPDFIKARLRKTAALRKVVHVSAGFFLRSPQYA